LEERQTEGARAAEMRRWTHLVDRLSRLVETMLDTSRLAQKRLELQFGTVDLQALVSGTVQRLAAVFSVAETSGQFHSEPEIFVRADPLRIEQAVENILLNAAKYGAGRDIEVSLAREEQWARLSVRDSGIGIAQVDHERIFARFERATSSANFGGLGLGLYLVRQVLDAHGGTGSVGSVPGEGAEFHVRLAVAEGGGGRIGRRGAAGGGAFGGGGRGEGVCGDARSRSWSANSPRGESGSPR